MIPLKLCNSLIMLQLDQIRTCSPKLNFIDCWQKIDRLKQLKSSSFPTTDSTDFPNFSVFSFGLDRPALRLTILSSKAGAFTQNNSVGNSTCMKRIPTR
jgi:hypothetical protein